MRRAGAERGILVVGPLPSPLNGMTVMTSRVLEALRKSNIRTLHLDTSDHRLIHNIQRIDLTNILLALRHGVDAVRLVRKERPALVYLPISEGTPGIFRDALLFAACRMHSVKTVVHFHGAEFAAFHERANVALRSMVDWMLKDCILAISLTQMTANSLSRLLSRIPIVVIPNGVPPQPAFLSTNPREGGTRVLYLSNLMERKGYRDLLTAAQIITASMDDVEFVVAGDWFGARERRAGQAIVAGAKHPDRIRFIGEVSGLRRSQLLGQADIFVFPPTRPEGQGLVLLEAMSAGLPIVATDIGPMRETLDPSCSILVKPSDPHALAGAIATLVRDAELRRRMGAAGKRRYQNHFSSQRCTSELLTALSNQLCGVPFSSVQT